MLVFKRFGVLPLGSELKVAAISSELKVANPKRQNGCPFVGAGFKPAPTLEHSTFSLSICIIIENNNVFGFFRPFGADGG